MALATNHRARTTCFRIAGDGFVCFGARASGNLAFELLNLATMMRQNWSQISDKTGIELKELTEAEMLADWLVTGSL